MKSLVSSHHSRGEFAGSSHWQDSAIEDLDHRSHDSSTQDISRRDEPPSAHSRAQLRSRRFSNRSSPDQGASDAPEDFPGHLSWKNRLRYFTWPFFTITMATGGIANVLYHGEITVIGPSKKSQCLFFAILQCPFVSMVLRP